MNAYVNHGRWVVDCDTPGCTGASRVQPPVEQAVVCDNCHQPSTVTYPEYWLQIDTVLARRVVPQTRNWLPGETVDDLVSENARHLEGVR